MWWGKRSILNDGKPFKITAVIKDIPVQSHFRFDFFISMPTLNESKENTWLSSNFQTYLLLKPGTGPAKIVAALPKIVHDYVGISITGRVAYQYRKVRKNTGNRLSLSLMPLADIHLRSNKIAENGAKMVISSMFTSSQLSPCLFC